MTISPQWLLMMAKATTQMQKKIENARIGSSRVQQAEFVHRRPAASG